MVNKTLGLFATIVGALYGGVLCNASLFALIFGVLQGVSMPATGCCRLPISIFTPWRRRSFSKTCATVWAATLSPCLITLCNKSFSATQFAAVRAIGSRSRVRRAIAGWFVEAHGWPTFYLFSVFAAVPGIVLLLLCRQTTGVHATHRKLYSAQFIHRPIRWRC